MGERGERKGKREGREKGRGRGGGGGRRGKKGKGRGEEKAYQTVQLVENSNHGMLFLFGLIQSWQVR